MTEPQYGQQTGVGSNELAEFIYRFEEAWERSPTPTLVTFLPPESVPWRQPVLMELVKVDQERRWRQGEHRLLESYLDDWPELRGSTNVLSELLEAECLTRAVIDTIPHIFELQARFPAIGSQIKLEAIEDQARKELRCQKQESRGPTKFPDSTVTRYQLRTVHEEGGLGRIWIADDKSLNRRVALKEVKPQLAHEAQAQQRLFREAQITGQLEHPNIVPIYELNRGASESPFYTMRFVPGTTLQEAIAAYHDDMKRGTSADQLGLRRLLGYFTSVCDAVAYAHSRHVIHRDLKPENVAIGDFGEVVVLDWGLAKVFDSSGQDGQVLPVLDQDAQSTESVIGGRIGTPAYMSPEQAAGCNDQVDKATDIYGLGTILFHILCGGPPHQGDSPQDVLADIASKPTPRVRAVCAQVSPPLAAICEKAMARRKGDRYFSAADLALDIQAWLGDEVVTAYRYSWADRLVRWLRRRLAWTVAAAVSVAAISLVSVIHVENRRHLAEQAAAHSDQAHRFALDALTRYGIDFEESLSGHPNTQMLRKAMLQATLEQLSDYVADFGSASDDQRVRAVVLQRKASVEMALGLYTEADASQRKAITLFEELTLMAPETDAAVRELAGAQQMAGDVSTRLGRIRKAHGHFDAALRRLMTLTTVREAHHVRALAALHAKLGDASYRLGDLSNALEHYTASHQRYDELAKREISGDKRELASSCRRLGALLLTLGNFEAANQHILRNVALLESIDENPFDLRDKADAASSQESLGDIQILFGRPEQGSDHFETALRLLNEVLIADPSNIAITHRLGALYQKLGDANRRTGNIDAAMKSFEKSKELFVAVANADSTNPEAKCDLVGCHQWIGRMHMKQGDFDAAQLMFRSALELAQAIAVEAPGDPYYLQHLAFTNTLLGSAYLEQGQGGLARPCFEQARDFYASLSGANMENKGVGRELFVAHSELGRVEFLDHNLVEARTNFQQAHAIISELESADRAFAPHQRDLSVSFGNLGSVSLQLHEFDAARKHFHRARELAQFLADHDSKNTQVRGDLAFSLGGLGLVETKAGNKTSAAEWFEAGIEILQELQAMESIKDIAKYEIWLEDQRQWLQACRSGESAISDVNRLSLVHLNRPVPVAPSSGIRVVQP